LSGFSRIQVSSPNVLKPRSISGKTTVKVIITTNEKINTVYFGLDGYLRRICNEPPYEYQIGKGEYRFFRAKGNNRITVYVMTNNGNVAYDKMDIFLIRLI
jgi:hypothetical protein